MLLVKYYRQTLVNFYIFKSKACQVVHDLKYRDQGPKNQEQSWYINGVQAKHTQFTHEATVVTAVIYTATLSISEFSQFLACLALTSSTQEQT